MAVPRKLRRRTPSRPAHCPDDLLDYAQIALASALPDGGRPPKDDLSTWVVTDDWPKRIPVSSVEVDVFQAWFGDVFDELFGPCQ
jgi:hypothetical protein